MYQKIIVFLAVVVCLNAQTLKDLTSSAKPLFSQEEINSANYLVIKKGANLRSKPLIKSSTIVENSNGGKYLLSSCKNGWCQIIPSGLYVYQNQIVR